MPLSTYLDHRKEKTHAQHKGFEPSINHSNDTLFEPARFKLLPCNALALTYTATLRTLLLTQYARAAGDIVREVLEDVRWLMDAMKPWGGGKEWAVGSDQEDGVIVVSGLQDRYVSVQGRARVKKRSLA